MRTMFPGYYRPSENEIRDFWSRALVVLDANVLLNFYRYSAETNRVLLKILRQLRDRLWVPHQAALEYQRNRLNEISKQRQAYQEIEETLQDSQKKLEAVLRSYRRHSLINIDNVIQPIAAAFSQQIKMLEEVRQKHPNLIENDDIRERLTTLLEGRVGDPFTAEKLQEIYKEGEQRYAKLIPPGFSDAKKPADLKFGDLILWNQVIDKGKSLKRPILLITDDVKDDWWWRHEGKIVGPHPALVHEMASRAEVPFYMYESDRFMEYARQFLKQQVAQGAIDEVRQVKEQEEAQRRSIEAFLAAEDAAISALRRRQEMLVVELRHINHELPSLKQTHDAELAAQNFAQANNLSQLCMQMESRQSELEKQIADLDKQMQLKASQTYFAERANVRKRVLRSEIGDELTRFAIEVAKGRLKEEQTRAD